MHKEFSSLKSKIPVDSPSNLTDYQYNHNGNQLAVSDSDGFVHVYNKIGEGFVKQTQFKVQDAAVWSISWGPSKYGRVLAIGSFKKKVAIYQQRNNQWVQVAYHFLHDGSVNKVIWAPIQYGLKLFSAGSDGKIVILELSGNNWVTKNFTAHDLSINTMDVLQAPLNQESGHNQSNYPIIATAGKDHAIKIWKCDSNQQPSNITSLFNQSAGYVNTCKFYPHKQMIRSIMFRSRWSEENSIQLFSCSQDGSVKISTIQGNEVQSQETVLEQECPVNKISQSMTGNMLFASVASGTTTEQTYCFKQNNGDFKLVQKWEVY